MKAIQLPQVRAHFKIFAEVKIITFSPKGDNDIALIKLKTPVTFNSNTYPACLASASPPDYANLTVSGWGTITPLPVALIKDIRANLNKVDVQVLPKEICSDFYQPFPVTSNMICAGSLPNGGKDFCYRDLGDPLAGLKNGAYELDGIASWGGCGSADSPGVYTNVANYYSWIVANGCSECQHA